MPLERGPVALPSRVTAVNLMLIGSQVLSCSLMQRWARRELSPAEAAQLDAFTALEHRLVLMAAGRETLDAGRRELEALLAGLDEATQAALPLSALLFAGEGDA